MVGLAPSMLAGIYVSNKGFGLLFYRTRTPPVMVCERFNNVFGPVLPCSTCVRIFNSTPRPTRCLYTLDSRLALGIYRIGIGACGEDQIA